MKKISCLILLFLSISCSDNNPEITNMRVDHYLQTARGEGQRLVYLVQQGDDIGADEWHYLYSEITGFDYELGYVYNLKVRKQQIKNPPADGLSVRYMLQEIISKEKVEPSTLFQITLKSNSDNFVTNNSDNGFQLLQNIPIDCDTFCNTLSDSLKSADELYGIFTYGADGTIKLQKLTSPKK